MVWAKSSSGNAITSTGIIIVIIIATSTLQWDIAQLTCWSRGLKYLIAQKTNYFNSHNRRNRFAKLQMIVTSNLIVYKVIFYLLIASFTKICRIPRDNRECRRNLGCNDVFTQASGIRTQTYFHWTDTCPRYFLNHNSDNSAQVFTKLKIVRGGTRGRDCRIYRAPSTGCQLEHCYHSF